MFKKSFIAMLAVFLVLFAAGCGNKGNNANTNKPAADKPEYSADKAILGYAELYAFGFTEHLKETGLTQADQDKYSEKVLKPLVQAFAEFPLSNDNAATMLGEYVSLAEAAMRIKTEIVKDDPENPVVKLSARNINQQAASEMVSSNESLIALGQMIGTWQAQGYSVDDMKANADFQKAAMEYLINFIKEIPINKESSIEITCQKRKGEDGKLYWEPKSTTELEEFVKIQ